jgi:hypothetical protein
MNNYNLRRNFGPDFVEALPFSPTLVADIKQLRKHRIRIRRVPGEARGWYDPDKRTVYLSVEYDTISALKILAHEKFHAIDDPLVPCDPKKITRRGYIRRSLDCEANAFMHELKVAEELSKANYIISMADHYWIRLMREQGRRAVRRKVGDWQNSITGEKYRDYYGRLWDEEAAKLQKAG